MLFDFFGYSEFCYFIFPAALQGVEVIPTPDQDETDFTKCLRILFSRTDKYQVSDWVWRTYASDELFVSGLSICLSVCLSVSVCLSSYPPPTHFHTFTLYLLLIPNVTVIVPTRS